MLGIGDGMFDNLNDALEEAHYRAETECRRIAIYWSGTYGVMPASYCRRKSLEVIRPKHLKSKWFKVKDDPLPKMQLIKVTI